MPTYDFEDTLVPADFYNAVNRPWFNTNIDANGGTRSLSSAVTGDNENSQFVIFGNFAAGNFNLDYRVDSEATDTFRIKVDGAAVVSTGGIIPWAAMPTQALTADDHCIQIVYTKDAGATAGLDLALIDNLVIPAFTDLKGDIEDFAAGLPGDFTNDVTNPWIQSVATDTPWGGMKSAIVGLDNTVTTITYTSPPSSPAGNMMVMGRGDSEANFDIFSVEIDSVEVFSSSGEYSGAGDPSRAHIEPVTAGSHVYEFIFTKDASDAAFLDTAFLDLFYEPSFSAVAPSGGFGPLLAGKRNKLVIT